MSTHTSFRRIIPTVLCVFALPVATLATGARSTQAGKPTAPSPGRSLGRAPAELATNTLGSRDLWFVGNRGQADPTIAFSLAGAGVTVGCTRVGLKVSVSSRDARRAVSVDFLGAAEIAPAGLDPLPTKISYFAGPRGRWRTGVPTYEGVAYRDLWPGIDLMLRAGDGRLKYEFVVRPGADPARIRLAWRGARAVALDASGALEVETAAGTLRDEAPVSFQEGAAGTTRIPTAFELEPRDSVAGERVCSFHVAAYDRAKPLTIDPAMIVYSGLFGGTSTETAFGVAADAEGNVYVAGNTFSSETEAFPVAGGPDLTYNPRASCDNLGSPSSDAFVAKIKADGSGLEYLGYIGGVCDQGASDVAVDAAGNAYVCGVTYSGNRGFPVTVGPRTTFEQQSAAESEAFVAKVSADGTRLLYCGYIGGHGHDYASAIAVDAAGSAYVTGFLTFPGGFTTIAGPDLTFGGGSYDAFLVKVKPDGTGLVYAGFLGGSDNDFGFGVAVDSAGAAYVAGSTLSPDLPVVAGPQLAPHANGDAFVAKVKPDGTGFVYLGYLGGDNPDAGVRVAVDSAGAAYVGGATSSTEASFPVAVGPDLTFGGGDSPDGFVAKVKPDGTGLVYCGYVGGDENDAVYGIAVDSTGAAYVAGSTTSSEATLPVSGGPDSTYNGGTDGGDAFVGRIKPNGSGFDFLGYIGGTDDDAAGGVALDGRGGVYVVGRTYSTETSFPIAGGPGLVNKGLADIFVTKLATGPPGPTISSVAKDGKFLVVTGANFERGSTILVNGVAKKTKVDPANPTTVLKSKKAGKTIMPGDTVTVRNQDGSVSNAVVFQG